MPNITATENAYFAASTALNNIADVINGRHYLGVNGYYVVITLDLFSPEKVRTKLDGILEDVNRIPQVVLDNYIIVTQETKSWVDGELNNFPDFSTRF